MFTGDGFEVLVGDTSSVSVFGGGGTDVVYLYDSPHDDALVARPGYAELTGQGFRLEANDFRYAHAYATSSGSDRDTANFEDSAAKDKFKLDWSNSGKLIGKLYGNDYYNRCKMFEEVAAAMSSGSDLAILIGSDQSDSFHGQRGQSRMTGSGYDVRVTGCDTVRAYATGGTDTATLEDSPADDTIRARPHKAVLWSGQYSDPDYSIMARNFDCYNMTSLQGGRDTAKLHDTVFDDLLVATDNMASLYKHNDSKDALYEAVAFETVKAYSSDNDGHEERCQVIGEIDFDLRLSGTWD